MPGGRRREVQPPFDLPLPVVAVERLALLTDPLPGGGQRWGCVGTVVAILGLLFFAAFLLLALTGGAMLLAL